jgi:phosphatidylethanolamine-binding protein (PEBP) family uncharacterized protein
MRFVATTAAATTLLCSPVPAAMAEEKPMNLTITSTAFSPNGAIPAPYICEGNDIAPPLAWSGVPAGTRSLALIVDDPDAPDPAAPG